MIRQSDKNAIFWFATVLSIIQRCPEQHSPLTHRCPRHCSAWFSALVDSAHLCLYWLFSLLLRKGLQTVMFDRENVWRAVIVDYYLYYNWCNECIAADFLRVGGTQWGHSPLITPLQRLIINNARNTRTIRKKYKQVEYGIFICIG